MSQRNRKKRNRNLKKFYVHAYKNGWHSNGPLTWEKADFLAKELSAVPTEVYLNDSEEPPERFVVTT